MRLNLSNSTGDPTSAPPRARATFGDLAEAAGFVAMLERFERGEVDAEEYRRYRLLHGIYGQRQGGVHMVRVKLPEGLVTAPQLLALADCAERFARGRGHVTTRQNLQFHFVKPGDVGPLMEAVARAGLTTREACSHAVRNVTACPYAGVCPGEPFDVTPYGEAVTRHFLRGELGSGLPRKFKIALSGCADDCARGAINDVGLVALVRDGQRGFRVSAGGGTSTLPRSGGLLVEFLPAGELLAACEAMVRLFAEEGNRVELKKARMKWVVERLGFDAFRARFERHLAAIRAEGGRPLSAPPPDEAAPGPGPDPVVTLGPPATDAYRAWRRQNARPQRQAGYAAATAWLRLGDVTAPQLRAVAELAERFGDGTARTTLGQNLLCRWVRDEELSAFWRGLDEAGLGEPFSDTPADVVSCPGADTCALAVTASRGAAALVADRLAPRAATGKGHGPRVAVSGCPNGCGQHHVAAIGLQGGTRRLGDRLVPQYHLLVGGGVDGGGARFGRLVAKVPARRVPEAVERLVALFDARAADGEGAAAFFQRIDLAEARGLLADLASLDEATARPEDFRDLGSADALAVAAPDGAAGEPAP